jgi:integrase
VKALSPAELAALVDEAPEGWRRLLVVTMATTGLRLSEALALRWSGIDTKERRLRVRERVREGKAGAPKSRAGAREVPISSTLARELAARRLASPFSRDNDFVFPSQTGRAHSASNLYSWFKPAAERAGVGWAGFHALRHSAASRWLLSGVAIAQVARLLGHEDPSFTLRTYIHMLPVDLPDGDALARAVGLGVAPL